LLLTRYKDIDYILNLDIGTGIELIKKAYERKTEDLLMQRWMMHYEKEISFDEFKEKLMIYRNNSNKTTDEILTDVKDIISSFNQEVKQ